MSGARVNRFDWERAIRDPKAGLPRDLLGLALLLATYSTGKTGDGIEVSEATLAADLGYAARTVRCLVAELRDGCGVIERTGGGNRYGPAEWALVFPDDLIERTAAVRDSRAAERARASKQPGKPRPRPAAVLPVYTGLDRPQNDPRPAAERPYTGRSASPNQDQDQEGAAAPRQSASAARPPPGGAAVTRSTEGDPGAAPGPAPDGRARLTGDEHLGQCKDCSGSFRIVGGGVVERHDGRLLGLGGDCPGSELPPVTPVRCITCGETGKAIGPAGECAGCARKRRKAERATWRSGAGHGICPECGQARAVTQDGRVCAHGGRPRCPGSRQRATRAVFIPGDRARAIADAFLDGAQDWRRRHYAARTALSDTIGRMLAEGVTEEAIGRGLAALHGADDDPAKLRSYVGALR